MSNLSKAGLGHHQIPLFLVILLLFSGCPGGPKYQRKPAPPPPRPKTGTGSGNSSNIFTDGEEEAIGREMRDLTARLVTIVFVRKNELPESSANIKRDLMKFAERDTVLESANRETLLYLRTVIEKEIREHRNDVEANMHNPAGIQFMLEREARRRYLEKLDMLIEKRASVETSTGD